jgi:FkbM family methyltransferase
MVAEQAAPRGEAPTTTTTTRAQRVLAGMLLLLALVVLRSVAAGRRPQATQMERQEEVERFIKRGAAETADGAGVIDLEFASDKSDLAPFVLPPGWPPRGKRVHCSAVRSWRQTAKVCALSRDHFGLFRAHLDREQAVYRLLLRTFRRGQFPSKAFVDVGSNHGLMSIFAGKMGARPIVAVEPNRALAGVIKYAFGKNNLDDDDAVVYNAACLDTPSGGGGGGGGGGLEMVRLTNQHIGEGGVGTILRGAVTTNHRAGFAGQAASIRAAPLSRFLPRPEDVLVGVLKIDVEGHELGVLRSLLTALGEQPERVVENVVIEYGPPSRWATVTGGAETSRAAAAIMAAFRDRGYGIRILPSFAMTEFLRQPVSAHAKREGHSRTNGVIVEDDWFVLNAMTQCDCEAYLWLYRHAANGTYDAVVRERWKNGNLFGFLPRFSLASLVLWCVGGMFLMFCVKVLHELGESAIRSARLREKRRARERVVVFKT